MKKRKLFSLFLAFIMVLSMVMPVMADETSAATQFTMGDVAGKLVIIHTNDTHGRDVAADGVLGTAAISQLKKDYEAAGADTLLLSAGDACQGTALVNQSQGADAIKFMDLAGYDAMCPGNHEFDWGLDNLQSITKNASFPVLAANVLRQDGSLIFKDHQIFTTKSGLKVGVFGLDTPETATKANPEKIKGINFLQGQALYDCAQQQVNALKGAGCDFIVALGHLGLDEETAATANRSVDLVNHVNGIDLFIDGHSHTAMEHGKPVEAGSYPSYQNNSQTLIVSTGSYLANAGVVTYDPAAKTMTPQLIAAGTYSGIDSSVNAEINAKDAEINAKLGQVFANTEVTLNGERDPGNRTQETNLGDFAADAILWSARQSTGGAVDAAITNGGGIRETIPAGDITMLDMKTVFPFGNSVAVLKISGQGLLEALEAATYCTPTALGAFPQVAGISFTIDTSMQYKNGEAYATYFKCANPGTRIKNVTIGGVPLDPAKTYTIATNDFTAVGGDTYYPFKDAYKATGFDTGIALEDALVDYTASVLNNVITAARYGGAEGRINIIASTGSVADSSQSSAYVVISGDSLWRISQKTYGTGYRWREIYNLNKNKIANPDQIQIGQELELPAA